MHSVGAVKVIKKEGFGFVPKTVLSCKHYREFKWIPFTRKVREAKGAARAEESVTEKSVADQVYIDRRLLQ